MHAYRAEAVLTEDGKLTLTGLPFQAGKLVEVIVLEPDSIRSGDRLVDEDHSYLVGLSNMMTEWQSDADELAYGDL
jgi:hypothetical protein